MRIAALIEPFKRNQDKDVYSLLNMDKFGQQRDHLQNGFLLSNGFKYQQAKSPDLRSVSLSHDTVWMDQDCSLKNREPDVPFGSWILEVGARPPQLDCTSSSLESVPCPLIIPDDWHQLTSAVLEYSQLLQWKSWLREEARNLEQQGILMQREDVILEWIFLPCKPNKKLKTYIEKISDLIHKVATWPIAYSSIVFHYMVTTSIGG
ncbi:hypothetical protein STEG23_035781 [Scotinomys teguina]